MATTALLVSGSTCSASARGAVRLSGHGLSTTAAVDREGDQYLTLSRSRTRLLRTLMPIQ